MSMLHPMFNHLGRSKKRRKGSKPEGLRLAEESHKTKLKSYGVSVTGSGKRSKRQLRGAIELERGTAHRKPNVSPTTKWPIE